MVEFLDVVSELAVVGIRRDEEGLCRIAYVYLENIGLVLQRFGKFETKAAARKGAAGGRFEAGFIFPKSGDVEEERFREVKAEPRPQFLPFAGVIENRGRGRRVPGGSGATGWHRARGRITVNVAPPE